MSDKIKMYCIVSRESLALMKGNRGKMITDGGHGWLHAFLDSQKRFPEHCEAYLNSSKTSENGTLYGGVYKITLAVDTTDELYQLQDSYKDICGVSLVRDGALTVFDTPTVVCLGIGPLPDILKKDDLKNLKGLV